MARARPIDGLAASESALGAARLILPVRLDELYAHAPAVADPAAARAHHDMRIAAKRLRYTMEIFAFLFPPSFEALIKPVRHIQDLLGLVHDCDVFVPFFERYLEGRRIEAEARLAEASAAPAAGVAAPLTMEDLRQAIAARAGSGERDAILRLIERTRSRRRTTFAEFQSFWGDLDRGGFRTELLLAIGAGSAPAAPLAAPPAPPAVPTSATSP